MGLKEDIESISGVLQSVLEDISVDNASVKVTVYRDALRELVEVHGILTTQGATEEYTRRSKAAWKKARDLLYQDSSAVDFLNEVASLRRDNAELMTVLQDLVDALHAHEDDLPPEVADALIEAEVKVER